MSTNLRCAYRLVKLVILFGLLLGVGCGGGGGDGGGSSGGPTPITYSGITTQAIITDSNSVDLSGGSLGVGQSAAAIGNVGFLRDETSYGIEKFNAIKIPQILEHTLQIANEENQNYGSLVGVGVIVSGSEFGTCGGRVDYTLDVNPITGSFSGDFSYIDFCEMGVALSGNVTADGIVNTTTNQLIEFNFSFANLTDSYTTLDGEISFDLASIPIEVRMDVLSQDNTSKKVYWAEKYYMRITPGPPPGPVYDYVDFTIDGTYYDPDHGYVTVSTQAGSDFRIYFNKSWPEPGGVLLLDGESGTAVRLTAVNALQCLIEADLDGDGTYEWSSGNIAWDSL